MALSVIRRRFRLPLSTCILLVIIALSIWGILNASRERSSDTRKSSEHKLLFDEHVDLSKQKVILAWTPFFGQPLKHSRYMPECGDSNCVLVNDRRFVRIADALVFHCQQEDLHWNDLPSIRHPWQRYAILMHESPMNTLGNCGKVPAFFNWTMTYRFDSDIVYPYGYLKQLPIENSTSSIRTLNEGELKTIVEGKSKLIVWFASNCFTGSGREKYVDVLKKYVPVDIFGKCGDAGACPREKEHECDEFIEKTYKFYIAFENTICKDYITEKYWNRYQLYSVPIVLQRSIYAGLVPNDSFIAVDDFENPEQLAAYLKHLDKHYEDYMKYFKWRREGWTNVYQTDGYKVGFCRLCEMLWQQPQLPPKIYQDINQWWIKEAKCDHGELVKQQISANAVHHQTREKLT